MNCPVCNYHLTCLTINTREEFANYDYYCSRCENNFRRKVKYHAQQIISDEFSHTDIELTEMQERYDDSRENVKIDAILCTHLKIGNYKYCPMCGEKILA